MKKIVLISLLLVLLVIIMSCATTSKNSSPLIPYAGDFSYWETQRCQVLEK